mmetsp:Transcript_36559/g.109879  ORF Transcript_36559/g.109879 Transcript_36559/m.109879 type:complete len:106 (+) Transcript_36559:337-654(+)
MLYTFDTFVTARLAFSPDVFGQFGALHTHLKDMSSSNCTIFSWPWMLQWKSPPQCVSLAVLLWYNICLRSSVGDNSLSAVESQSGTGWRDVGNDELFGCLVELPS